MAVHLTLKQWRAMQAAMAEPGWPATPAPRTRSAPTPLPDYCRVRDGPPGRWEVTVDRFQPTPLNVLRSVHWAVAHRLKTGDAQVIGQALRAAGVSRAVGRRRLRYTIVMGPRQRGVDPDAFDKSLRDALTRCGAIRDDNRRWIDPEKPTYDRGPSRAIRIFLEDL